MFCVGMYVYDKKSDSYGIVVPDLFDNMELKCFRVVTKSNTSFYKLCSLNDCVASSITEMDEYKYYSKLSTAVIEYIDKKLVENAIQPENDKNRNLLLKELHDGYAATYHSQYLPLLMSRYNVKK